MSGTELESTEIPAIPHFLVEAKNSGVGLFECLRTSLRLTPEPDPLTDRLIDQLMFRSMILSITSLKKFVPEVHFWAELQGTPSYRFHRHDFSYF